MNLRDIVTNITMGLEESLLKSGVPFELAQFCMKGDPVQVIQSLHTAMRVLSVIRVRSDCSTSSINRREIKSVSRIDAYKLVTSLTKDLGCINDAGSLVICYKDLFKNEVSNVKLECLCDSNRNQWEYVLNSSQDLYKYEIMSQEMDFATSLIETTAIIKKDIEKKGMAANVPNDMIIGHVESVSAYVKSGKAKIEDHLNDKSKLVQMMSSMNVMRDLSKFTSESLIDDVLPLFRSGSPDKFYNSGLCDQADLDRESRRVYSWKTIIKNIAKDKYDQILIYGASNRCLPFYKKMNLSIMSPEDAGRCNMLGITIDGRPHDKKYCLIDPFNSVIGEFRYNKDTDTDEMCDIMYGHNLKISGRLIKCAIDKTNVVAPYKDKIYIPFINHKAEYYAMDEEIVGNNMGWKVDSKMNLKGLVNFVEDKISIKFSYADNINPVFMLVIANLYRNYLWYHPKIPDDLRSYYDLLEDYICQQLRIHGVLKSINPHYFIFSYYLQFYFSYMINLSVRCKKEFKHVDKPCFNFPDLVKLLREGESYNLKHVLGKFSRSNFKPNRDYARTVNCDLFAQDDKAYINKNEWNIGNYKFIDDYRIKSYKDDVYLDVKQSRKKYKVMHPDKKKYFQFVGKKQESVVSDDKFDDDRGIVRGQNDISGPIITDVQVLRDSRKSEQDWSSYIRKPDLDSIKIVKVLESDSSVSSSPVLNRSSGIDPIVGSIYEFDKASNYYDASHNYVSRDSFEFR